MIDDFFSFVIKMPLLHRLACFRDDVVFIVLLYQYWIYKVDATRVNEYGFSAVDISGDKATEKTDENAATRALAVESKKDQ